MSWNKEKLLQKYNIPLNWSFSYRHKLSTKSLKLKENITGSKNFFTGNSSPDPVCPPRRRVNYSRSFKKTCSSLRRSREASNATVSPEAKLAEQVAAISPISNRQYRERAIGKKWILKYWWAHEIKLRILLHQFFSSIFVLIFSNWEKNLIGQKFWPGPIKICFLIPGSYT